MKCAEFSFEIVIQLEAKWNTHSLQGNRYWVLPTYAPLRLRILLLHCLLCPLLIAVVIDI